MIINNIFICFAAIMTYTLGSNSVVIMVKIYCVSILAKIQVYLMLRAKARIKLERNLPRIKSHQKLHNRLMTGSLAQLVEG